MHRRNGEHKSGGVEDEGESGHEPCIVEEVVERSVGFDDFDDKVGGGVEYGRYEPHPLCGTEEGNGFFDNVEEGVVSDFD